MNKKNKSMPTGTKGYWKVTTEGDVEGRSIENLGIYYGYLDEIAFYLASQTFYSLEFKKLDNYPVYPGPPTRNEAIIQLGIDTGTWEMDHKERVEAIQNMFDKDNRDVSVEKEKYFASVKIRRGRREDKKEILKKEALNKLTKEEKESLGITE